MELEFTAAIQAWLRRASISPWHPVDDPGEDGLGEVRHHLYQLCGQRGLPMPAGFLLSSGVAASPWPLPPRHGGQQVFAVHPRIGQLVSTTEGFTWLFPRSETNSGVEFRVGPMLSRSWQQLFEALQLLEGMSARWYALWIRVVTSVRMSSRYGVMASGLAYLRQARVAGLWARLGLDEAHRLGPDAPWQGLPLWCNATTTLLDLGDDVLIACDRIDDIRAVLSLANAEGMWVEPEAWGGHLLWNQALPEVAPCYVQVFERDACHRVEGRVDGARMVWSYHHGEAIMWQKHVWPGRVSATDVPVIPDASPRLLAYLRGAGCLRYHALQSPTQLAEWLAEHGLDEAWSVLVSIEASLGGLVAAVDWGVHWPEVMGPWAMIELEDSLRWRNVVADEEGAVLAPWPRVRFGDLDAMLVSWSEQRYGFGRYVDREGRVYLFDAELDTLEVIADSLLKALEKRALWQALYDHDRGVAATHHSRLIMPVFVTAAIWRDLGLAVIEEASDRVTCYARTESMCVISRAAEPWSFARGPQTEVYALDADDVVPLAKALREVFPSALIRVRGNSEGEAVYRRLRRAQVCHLELAKGTRGWGHFETPVS